MSSRSLKSQLRTPVDPVFLAPIGVALPVSSLPFGYRSKTEHVLGFLNRRENKLKRDASPLHSHDELHNANQYLQDVEKEKEHFTVEIREQGADIHS